MRTEAGKAGQTLGRRHSGTGTNYRSKSSTAVIKFMVQELYGAMFEARCTRSKSTVASKRRVSNYIDHEYPRARQSESD